MSRIGKKIIKIPAGVSVTDADGVLKIKGPKGELSYKLPKGIDLKVEDDELSLTSKGPELSRFYGLSRAILANLIHGVAEGFSKNLEIVGVGYRANVQGDKLVLQMGYSHPVEIATPPGISFAVEKNVITVSGIDKQAVGAVTARIRAVRPPEPYKGKGIKYADEHVRRKAGKSAVKAAGAKAAA